MLSVHDMWAPYPGAFGEYMGNTETLRMSASSFENRTTLTRVEMEAKGARLRELQAALQTQAATLEGSELHLASLTSAPSYDDVLKNIEMAGGLEEVGHFCFQGHSSAKRSAPQLSHSRLSQSAFQA